MNAARWGLAVLVLLGLLAPVIANDVPVVADVGGTLRFPALRSYLGRPSPGPDPSRSESWREWWLRTDAFVVMPPWPYGPASEPDLAHRYDGPSLGHPFGRDELGRDLLARVIWGARSALWIAGGTVLLALLLGVPIGAWAGWRGGLVDRLLSLVIEVTLCFPALFLVLVAAALFGTSVLATIVVLGSVSWTSFARLLRGEMLSLREREFVLAARGLGVSMPRLMMRHLLPEVRGPLLVNASFLAAVAVIVESTLAFLGLGSGAGDYGVSWGTLLAFAKEPVVRGEAWHLWAFPAMAVIGTVWCLHAAADPRKRPLPTSLSHVLPQQESR